MSHVGMCTPDEVRRGCTSESGQFKLVSPLALDFCNCGHASSCSETAAPGYSCPWNESLCAPGYEKRSTFVTGDNNTASAQNTGNAQCFEFCAPIER